MRKFITSLVFICLVGCHSTGTSTKTPHILRMNISREPPTMDPRKGSEWVGSAMHFMLFEGLMRLNPDGSLTPAQARSVEISDDRLHYTFHLRGTLWSDGSRVTAKDFELAWKKIIDPQFGAANAHLLFPIKNAEKVKKGELPLDQVGIYSKDDQTFVVVLEKPTPYFLDLISFCIFFPVNHTIDEKNPQWMLDASSQFVSNGPFVLKKWKHNQEIVFEKNKSYWEASSIDLDQVHVSMITDENTALNMYQSGQLDIIGMVVSPIPTDALHHFYEKGFVKNQSAPATTFISFNTGRYPFNNKHIRKALAYAVNREEIVQNITQLGEKVATNLIPACLHQRSSPSYFDDHDILKAREELMLGFQELGIQDLPKITLEYSQGETHHKIAQVLQEQWKKNLGIHVEIQKFEHKMLLDRLASRTYDLATTYWFAQYKDPMSIFERFKLKKNTKNYPDWENSEYSKLMDQSFYDPTPEKRERTFARAEAILIEEMPLTPLYHWQTSFMMKDHLGFKSLTPEGAFDYSRIYVKENPP